MKNSEQHFDASSVSRPPRRARPAPRGFAMIELFVGLAVLGVALTVGLLAFEQSLIARRLRERREAARELVVLSLERARTLALSTQPTPLDMGVPKQLQARLPGAKCALSIADGPAPELKRIHVEVRCTGLSAPESGDETVAFSASS